MTTTTSTSTTTTAATTGRDDLFTHIHKALRLGLFDVTVAVGRVDWDDAPQLAELGRRWRALLALLRSHTDHEDHHILRLLDGRDPVAIEPVADQHRDLDDLLDDLAQRFERALAAPTPAAGLALYRDLARFVAAYLPHLHDEETRVMDRIWACCTDEEIAATRGRFMADTTPEVQATSLEYLLPALDRTTRRSLVAGLAAAPPAVFQGVIDIAERVLPAADAAELRTLQQPAR